MLKTVTNGNLNFHAQVKAHYPPTIVDSFADDSGELQYVLANGHTTPAHRYNAIWNPPIGLVKAKWETKGDGIDSRTNWIK